MIELVDVPGRTPNPLYSAVSAGTGERIIHIAGQVGTDDAGVLAGPGLQEQASQALRNVATALKAAGATLDDLAAITVYVTDWETSKIEELAAGLLGAGPHKRVPATLIGVAQLYEPAHLIEIQAVAVAA